jgi:amidase
MPFAPTFDTVGIVASSIDVLTRAADVLLSMERPPVNARPRTIHILTEAFALADADVQTALAPAIKMLRQIFGASVCATSLGRLCEDSNAADLASWLEIYRMLQGTEADSCLGAWIADARPEFGPATAAGFEFVRKLDRSRIGELARRRERYGRKLRAAMRADDLLCMPTAPTIAPLKSAVSYDRNGDFYRRALSMTAVSGVARLPQLSLPLAMSSGAPIGLSLLGAHGEDALLLQVVSEIEARWHARASE